MFWAGAAMFAGALATGLTHGPLAVVVLFIVLMVLCGLAGFAFVLIGAGKGRAENQQILAEAEARARPRRDGK